MIDMKRFFSIFLSLAFCVSSLPSQELLSEDSNHHEGGTRNIQYWSYYNLKYYIRNSGGGLTFSQCETAIQNAFSTWAQYTNFTFTRTYSLSQADIELKWDADMFELDSYELTNSTLGYFSQTNPGTICFNPYKTFTVTSSGNNLQAVTLREIGRVLGLDYVSNSLAVMYYGNVSKLDLTGYDLSVFYTHYAFPGGSLTGPRLVSQTGDYVINNLPSGLSTSWSINDSHYNNTSYLMGNYGGYGHCRLELNPSYDLTSATLTATVKKGSVSVKTLQMEGIYAYSGFKGYYTSGSLSGDIHYSLYFNIKANTATTITSPNFYDATVSYSSGGATPTAWGFIPSNGILNFKAPAGSAPVIINVHDVCGNDYILYAMPSSYGINVSYAGNSITVMLVEDDDASKDFTPSQSWTLEVRNASTGVLMATQSSASRSESISTVGWPKGVYIVKVTIGEEELTEKVIVR